MESVDFYHSLGIEGMSKLTSKKKTEQIIAEIMPFLRGRKKILDIGCGYGRIAEELSKRNFEVHAIDNCKKYIDYAKKITKTVTYEIKDMKKLYYDEEFDATICLWNTLLHMTTEEEQKNALQEIIKSLKNKGILVIEIIYYDEDIINYLEKLGEIKDNKLNFSVNGVKTKLAVIKSEKIKELLQSTGFEVINSQKKKRYDDEHLDRLLIVGKKS